MMMASWPAPGPPSHYGLIPVTVPITVRHSQEDQQEDQEEEDEPEDPVDHGRGDRDGDIAQAPHPPGLGRESGSRVSLKCGQTEREVGRYTDRREYKSLTCFRTKIRYRRDHQ